MTDLEAIYGATTLGGVHIMVVGLKKGSNKGDDHLAYYMTVKIMADDIPNMLLRDALGTEYLATFTRMNSMSEPEPRWDDVEMDRAVMMAGMLCKDEGFQRWLLEQEYINDLNEEDAAEWLRNTLGISSRKEIGEDEEVYLDFIKIRNEFYGKE